MNELTDLPNIGDVLADRLNAAGIFTYEELKSKGSVEAVLKIKEENLDACINMLYALEGAIQGKRWHGIPKDEREVLKKKLIDAR